jgi:hypothetical protein
MCGIHILPIDGTVKKYPLIVHTLLPFGGISMLVSPDYWTLSKYSLKWEKTVYCALNCPNFAMVFLACSNLTFPDATIRHRPAVWEAATAPIECCAYCKISNVHIKINPPGINMDNTSLFI